METTKSFRAQFSTSFSLLVKIIKSITLQFAVVNYFEKKEEIHG